MDWMSFLMQGAWIWTDPFMQQIGIDLMLHCHLGHRCVRLLALFSKLMFKFSCEGSTGLF
jgi:hypothetical protein